MFTSSDAGVFPFTGARKSMQYPQITEVQAYWEALRTGNEVPLRADVDPRGIEGALENAFILERVAPKIARFRVAGAHLTNVVGMEVRGMTISAIFEPETRNEIAPLLEQVFLAPAVVDLDLRAETGSDRPILVGRLLVLPLRSDLGDVSRALGCLVTQGGIGRRPRRFEITGRRVTPTAIPTGRPPLPEFPRQAGFAEAATGFLPRPPRAVGRDHLRLVKSD